MNWQIYAAFAATFLLFAISPGPAVLLTVGHGMKSGWAASPKRRSGCRPATECISSSRPSGWGALLLASEQVFHTIKYAGAAYLAFLRLKTIWNARKAAEPKSVQQEESRKLSDRPFWQAALMQLANPKSVPFFGALMPQFIDPRGPLVLQYALFAAICFVAEMPVLAVYGWLASQGRRFTARPQVALWRERLFRSLPGKSRSQSGLDPPGGLMGIDGAAFCALWPRIRSAEDRTVGPVELNAGLGVLES